MKSALIVFAVALTCVLARKPRWNELDGYAFKHYCRDFRMPYVPGTDEYAARERVFLSNMDRIRQHNADAYATYKKGVNHFTHMTDAEWKEYNRAYVSTKRPAPTTVYKKGDDTVPPRRTVDWRFANPPVLTGIKNQGSCGSCWAHAATSTLESSFALLTGQLAVLAQQQITSCSLDNNGCGGGDPALAMWFVNSTKHGLTSDWAYPYVDIFAPNMTWQATTPCRDISKGFPAKFDWFAELTEVGVLGVGEVTSNDAAAAMEALQNVGPLAILVAAGNWRDYESGIYVNNASKGENHEWGIDHAVQMVGYGHDDSVNKDYWVIRNSWGTLWGEAGYIRLDKPAVEPCAPGGSPCGTSSCLSSLSYPVVKENPYVVF